MWRAGRLKRDAQRAPRRRPPEESCGTPGSRPIGRAGLQPRGRLGHSVGFTGVTGPERFTILPGNGVPLRDRVAFVLHPCVFDKASGAVVQLGDTLVMENGSARFLSSDPLPYEL